VYSAQNRRGGRIDYLFPHRFEYRQGECGAGDTFENGTTIELDGGCHN
jgi:hypothetical protein